MGAAGVSMASGPEDPEFVKGGMIGRVSAEEHADFCSLQGSTSALWWPG